MQESSSPPPESLAPSLVSFGSLKHSPIGTQTAATVVHPDTASAHLPVPILSTKAVSLSSLGEFGEDWKSLERRTGACLAPTVHLLGGWVPAFPVFLSPIFYVHVAHIFNTFAEL